MLPSGKDFLFGLICTDMEEVTFVLQLFSKILDLLSIDFVHNQALGYVSGHSRFRKSFHGG
jgi:hypothetical protein